MEEEKLLGLRKDGLDSIVKENVIVITNNTKELNVFVEYEIPCLYTSNILNTVKDIKELQDKGNKNFKIKEIYLCFTEQDFDTYNYYRKFKEESFIATKLNELGIDAKSIHIDTYRKDMQIPSLFNETNKELLAEYLNKIKNSYIDKLDDTKKSFIKNRRALFRQEQFKKLDGTKISTGFQELDKMFSGGLEEGLYVLTGGSSLGKTAFATNLAENIAEQKQYVLYYSLEMKESNLVARGISRQMYKRNNKTTVSFKTIENGDIFLDDDSEKHKQDQIEYMEAEDYYFDKIGEYLTIEQGNLLSTSHNEIYNKAKIIRDMTAKAPIVVVDYLQQMTSATNPDALKSIIIEQNIAGLKQLSRDFETPVIVISSLSRADALEPISQQSFAHTSAIEYTADVCMGVAFEVIYSERFKAAKNLADKRLIVNEAIAEPTRTIRLSIVKNRLGIASKDILMHYIPKNNIYMECPEHMKDFTEVDSPHTPKSFKEEAKQTSLKILQ